MSDTPSLPLSYRQKKLFFDDCALEDLGSKIKTPSYLYSEKTIVQQAQALKREIKKYWPGPFRICYAFKANSSPALIDILKQQGLGADVVSYNELDLALKSSIDFNQIVFSGVGKTREEIFQTLKATGGKLLALNVESEEELYTIEECARKLSLKARVAFRGNPKILAGGHRYIATGDQGHKFGIDLPLVPKLIAYCQHSKHLEWVGPSMHIGSQLTTVAPIKKALMALRDHLLLVQKKYKIYPQIIDVGGGLGIDYKEGQKVLSLESYVKTMASFVLEFWQRDFKSAPLPTLVFEPGRFLVARSGILITRVIRQKYSYDKRFVVVDAGMNDLIRPALYGAYHKIFPASQKRALKDPCEVVGPVCESADFLGKNRFLSALKEGDLLTVADCGAYGRSMASNYNSRQFTHEYLLNSDGQLINLS